MYSALELCLVYAPMPRDTGEPVLKIVQNNRREIGTCETTTLSNDPRSTGITPEPQRHVV